MAVQVATLTLGVGAVVAATAEARADTAEAGAAGGPDVASVEQVTSHGWSCWGGPISRGPLAPPSQDLADAAALLAEMPS